MKAPSEPLNMRLGVAAGLLCLAVVAPGIILRSETPFLTLVETLAVGLVAVFVVSAVVVAINRRRAHPSASPGPALRTQGAAALGLGVGLLTEAVLSARTADPPATYVSNVAFVVWVALLVTSAVLVTERWRIGQPGS